MSEPTDFHDMKAFMAKVLDRVYLAPHQFTQADRDALTKLVEGGQTRHSVTAIDGTNKDDLNRFLLHCGTDRLVLKKSVGPIDMSCTQGTIVHVLHANLEGDPAIAADLAAAFHDEVDTLRVEIPYDPATLVELLDHKPKDLKHLELIPTTTGVQGTFNIDASRLIELMNKALDMGLETLTAVQPLSFNLSGELTQRFVQLSIDSKCNSLLLNFDKKKEIRYARYQLKDQDLLPKYDYYNDRQRWSAAAEEEGAIAIQWGKNCFLLNKRLIRYLRSTAEDLGALAAPMPQPREEALAADADPNAAPAPLELQRLPEDDDALLECSEYEIVCDTHAFTVQTLQYVFLFLRQLDSNFESTWRFLSERPGEPYCPGWQVQFAQYIFNGKDSPLRLRILSDLMGASHFFNIPELRWFALTQVSLDAQHLGA